MTNVERADRWRYAFAVQSASDGQVYQRLCKSAFPACHRLHYLQMYLEKLAKALLWNCNSEHASEKRHAVVARVMPQVFKETWRRRHGSKLSQNRVKQIRALCREIDLLCPAVDDEGRRRDNCEYPWAGLRGNSPEVSIPAREEFRVTERLHSQDGKDLLKIAAYVCAELCGE